MVDLELLKLNAKRRKIKLNTKKIWEFRTLNYVLFKLDFDAVINQ
jgi:hypothetical protein